MYCIIYLFRLIGLGIFSFLTALPSIKKVFGGRSEPGRSLPSGGYPSPGGYPQPDGYPQPGGFPQPGGYPRQDGPNVGGFGSGGNHSFNL